MLEVLLWFQGIAVLFPGALGLEVVFFGYKSKLRAKLGDSVWNKARLRFYRFYKNQHMNSRYRYT